MATISKSSVFALTAAHGITQRTIATWNPFLPRTPRVLVPVQVDALVVRQEGGNWADCALRVPPAGSPLSSRRDNLPQPFTNLAKPRPAGVYLHWALPSALTHGVSDTTKATFPAIPDRWLVIRAFPSKMAGRRSVRGWVLRAGDAPTPGANPGDPAVPPQAIPLENWAESAAPADNANPLTSAGPGDLTWAAYYDNVVNRLAFYDSDLANVSGPLGYLVCGWYSNPADDPLGSSQVQSLNDFNVRMQELQWSLRDGEFIEQAASRFQEYTKNATMAGLVTLEASGLGAYSSRVSAAANAANTAAARAAAPAAPSTSARVLTNPTLAYTSAAPEAVNSVVGANLNESGQPIGGAYTTNGSWWPQNTVMHGSVVAIGWPGVSWPGNERGILSGEIGGPPDASTIRVIFAETITEGLGNLVAATNNSPDQGRLLEAFALGALREFEKPDGRATLDAALHSSAFVSLDGGSVTEEIVQQGLPPTTPPVPTPVQPQAGIFSAQQPPPAPHAPISSPLAKAASIAAQEHISPEKFSETNILPGGFREAASQLSPPPAPVTPSAPQTIAVARALPRLYAPADPVILLQNCGRAMKFGADTRFSQDGTLVCRLSGFCVTELSCSSITGQPIRPAVTGDDMLENGIENGSVPLDTEDLLREFVLLDPGSSVAAANSYTATFAGAGSVPQLAQRFSVEQTAWWATWDPRFDSAPLLAHSGIAGTLPSPVALTPPNAPWYPIHLDWELQFIPSTNGVNDWQLGEIDYQPAGNPPSADGAIKFNGRAHLTAGAAKLAGQAIRNTLDQASRAGGAVSLANTTHVLNHSMIAKVVLDNVQQITEQLTLQLSEIAAGDNAVDTTSLADIATTLENMDVLTGAFDGFNLWLRGNYPRTGSPAPTDGTIPTPFVPFRAGFLQLTRLRLVDSFGQFVDLAGSSATTTVDPTRLMISDTLSVSNQPGLAALPPRFTARTRAWLRYMAADDSGNEAGATISPVCGYLMPNHPDGALEFFDIDGSNLGFVRPDPAAGIVWEDAPGVPSTVGVTPERAVPNGFLAGVARGLLDWGMADISFPGGRETALSAILRTIDATLWSVDPFGHIGDEHLALLVGHPVAVMRAKLRLEVQETIAPAVIQPLLVPVRLGALTHWPDGLLGYFVNDDYDTLHCADASVAGFARQVGPGQGFLQPIDLVAGYAANFAQDIAGNAAAGAAPVTHPYVDASGILWVQANQDVTLTLLVEPLNSVFLTAGLLPRKDVGMRREWVTDALAKISPTFRFGPVLVNPQAIRMPVANEIQGTWSWDHRTDITDWGEDPVTNATADAIIPPDPATGSEGWLRLSPPAPAQNTGRNTGS